MNREVDENSGDVAPIELLADEELERLNRLLPWAAFTLDSRGRALGVPHSTTKRATPQSIPDKRIIELNEFVALADRSVLEVGCFEGIHTCGLAQLAREVIGLDSRIENVAKTIVRCALLGYRPRILCWDLESGLPEIDISHDVLHHVGVLYHLSDPATHLKTITRVTRHAIMLDTHVCDPSTTPLESYSIGGRTYRYARKAESGRDQPFAGMRDHAKWLALPDLEMLVEECGFRIYRKQIRDERNGLRVLLFAKRSD
jgi:SAM-dependent methyltransferase